jgi:hypothetical protein
MTHQNQKLNMLQIFKYFITPYDSRESTIWSINDILDVKYGTVKAFFWVFIVVIVIILVEFK